MNSHETIQIWKSAKAGDRNSLALLLNTFQDQIYRFCRSRLGQESAAVDATQETAVRLIANLHSFQERGQLSTWVLGIANNVCRELHRQNQKWKQAPDPDVESLTRSSELATELEQRDDSLQLKQAIQQLPERQQEVVLLRFFETLSVEDTADVMGVKPGTVKATTSQALENLRKHLRHLDTPT